jgi:PST family polysaccharide transporter
MQISGYIFPLFTFPHITRTVGVANYGTIVFMYAFMFYFQIVIDFGFILLGASKCSIQRENKLELSYITFTILQSKLLLAFFAYLILFILTNSLDVFQDNLLYSHLAFLPVFLTVFIPDFFFRGIENIKLFSFITVFSNLIYTILVYILINKKSDFFFIPLIQSFCNIIVIIWSWYFMMKTFELPIKFVGINSIISFIRESFGFFMSRIATSVYSASNIFILGTIGVNSVGLGNFGVANNIANMGKSMFTPIADSVYPYMVRNKDFKLIRTILIWVLPVILIGSLLVYFYADKIILILCGADYLAAVIYFRAMIPVIVLALPIYLLGFPTLGAIGRFDLANKSVIYSSIFHIAGLFFLYFTGFLSFMPVIILTFFTEFLILYLRLYYIYMNKNLFYLKTNV